MADRLATYYTDDHRRLDYLFEKFERLKTKDPAWALKILREFRAGLEQHMAWEEAILFSEYDARVKDPDRSVTDQLLSEHGEILNVLDRLETKLAEPSSNTAVEEARLVKALADHNRTEETGLYLQLDRLLTDQEREEIFTRMRESAWTKE